jgi:hypothetical protein
MPKAWYNRGLHITAPKDGGTSLRASPRFNALEVRNYGYPYCSTKRISCLRVWRGGEMTTKGHKLTPEQRERLSKAHLGQRAWNTGTGGCKKGHDPDLYVQMPGGVFVCLGCKRENGQKYRAKNREAIRIKSRVARYKIDVLEFERLYDLQDACCAICRTAIDKKGCHIDHDHATGKVRGILCASCNTGIGLFKDSPSVLIQAAEYLKDHNGD